MTAVTAPAVIAAPSAEPVAGAAILRVENLRIHFPIRSGLLQRQTGAVRAVDGVSFEVRARETFGLVGESGCGKTTLARGVLQLVPHSGGNVYYRGADLARLSGKELRRTRRHIQMVFQDPFASLDPRMTVGESVAEPLEVMNIARGPELQDRVEHLFQLVRLDPKTTVRFPHQLSGGQCQRVGIARALAADPDLIICDEPVSALDVSIRAQVLNLLEDLRTELGLTLVFIAHDLNVVRHISDRIAVMYLGVIMEQANEDELFTRALHPYSRALISAVSLPDPSRERARRRIVLGGDIPSPADPPSGCRFRTRCPLAQEICARQVPPLKVMGGDHLVACHFAEQVPELMPISSTEPAPAAPRKEPIA